MGQNNETPDFNKIVQKIIAGVPAYAAVEATKFFKENFVRQGFLGNGLDRWPASGSPLSGKRTLYGVGNLMQSVRPGRVSFTETSVQSDTAYSALHNDGGTITVTPAMKRFWWAKYYQFAGKIKTTTRGQVSRAAGNRRVSGKAAFCKAMALMKAGSKIKIPKRQFIGESATLMANLEQWVFMQIGQTTGK